MGQAHKGAQVLVIAPGTNELSTISTPNMATSVGDKIQEHGTLVKLGDEGQLEFKRTLEGLGAERLRVLFERVSREQVLKWIGDAMERRYPGAKLAGEPTMHDDRLENVFSIAAAYKVPKLAIDRDGTWIVFFRPDNMLDVLLSSPSATRTMPLRIGAFPYRGKYSFEMTFPETVSVVTDPYSRTRAKRFFCASSHLGISRKCGKNDHRTGNDAIVCRCQ